MIAIIGAGISGLSLAYFLEEKKLPYVIFESQQQVGGCIQTWNNETYQLENGPNSLLVDPEMEDLLVQIGLGEDIQAAQDVSKYRYIFKQGEYRRLPDHPLKLLTSTYFTLSAKWAIYQEMHKKPEEYPHESLGHFIRRRFNQEIVDYALNPFVAGIYAGDPDQLLIEKTFPILKEYERTHGSILRGVMKNRGAARKKSVNFKNGMASLPETLARKISNLHLDSPVKEICQKESKFFIKTPKGDFTADRVVLACPAFQAGAMLKGLYTQAEEILNQVNYPPMVAVYSAYKKSQVGHSLDGFGGLNPGVEGLFTSGSIWTSSVFPNRCPDDEVLFTSFIGGTQYVSKTQNTEQITLGKVHQELAQYYSIQGTPVFQSLYKWEKAIPQYDRQILKVHEFVEEIEQEQIFVNANWKDGVSLSDCIKKSKALAEKLVSKEDLQVSSKD